MLLDQFPFPVTTLMAKGVSLHAALTDLQHFRDEFNEALSTPRECGVAVRTDQTDRTDETYPTGQIG